MSILLLNANALHTPLADGSVNCCVTSPPYYGLRDYGTASWEGGSAECDHIAPPAGGTGESSKLQVMQKRVDFASGFYKDICGKCGAVRVDSQIGLEETPEAYVEKLVQVFREVRRVLADTGTVWLNLGDSYAGSGGVGNQRDGANKGNMPHFKNPNSYAITRSKRLDRGSGRWGGGNIPAVGNLKPKDLIGIPWLTAFALRADGWYLRSDIIWHKPNPMPESVTDRPTKSHEYIFLLSKSAKYYYDHEAILEPLTNSSVSRLAQDTENQAGSTRANGGEKSNGNMKAVIRGGNTSWRGERTVPSENRRNAAYSFSRKVNESPKPGERSQHREDREFVEYTGQRNKRSVWTVTTQPYSGAHFATFPPKLIEPCIKAGCPEGGVVLDPFSGSGTTAMVARKLGRRAVGLDLSFTYIRECARPRLQLDALDEFENGKKADANYMDLPLFMEHVRQE